MSGGCGGLALQAFAIFAVVGLAGESPLAIGSIVLSLSLMILQL